LTMGKVREKEGKHGKGKAGGGGAGRGSQENLTNPCASGGWGGGGMEKSFSGAVQCNQKTLTAAEKKEFRKCSNNGIKEEVSPDAKGTNRIQGRKKKTDKGERSDKQEQGEKGKVEGKGSEGVAKESGWEGTLAPV